MTPTARSLRWLRQRGFVARVVECWVPHTQVRRDLFGFADIIGIHPRDRLILLVQTTTSGHLANRLEKARRLSELRDWLRAGGRFQVHGWGEAGLRIVEVTGDQLDANELERPARRRRKRKPAGVFDGAGSGSRLDCSMGCESPCGLVA